MEEKPVEETSSDVAPTLPSVSATPEPEVTKTSEAAAKPTVEKGKPEGNASAGKDKPAGEKKKKGGHKKCEMEDDEDEDEVPAKESMIKEPKPKPTKPAVPSISQGEEDAQPSYAIVTDVSSGVSIRGSAVLGLLCKLSSS